MSKPVRIRIVGSDASGTDAPTADDFIRQLQDVLALFENVERSVDGGDTNHLIWKVTDATMNSPLVIELTPFAKNHAENIDQRARKVVRSVAQGVREFYSAGEPPAYFNARSAAAAESIIRRAINGLAQTEILFDQDYGVEKISVDRQSAYTFIKATDGARVSEFRPHRELGAVEGYINRVELDGYGRPVVWLRTRIDGDVVKCVSSERGLDRIGHLEVHEVLSGLRVQVFGLINYRNIGKISSIEVDYVRVCPRDDELPTEEDIISPNFTDGLTAEEFLRGLRSDE